jgi:hypothetical protein
MCGLDVLTGKATEMDVASRAAIRVITHKLMNAAIKRHPGWNFSGVGEGDRSAFASFSGCVCRFSGFKSSFEDNGV